MKRLKHDIIVDALGGRLITDLMENWTFTIEEVSPYVFIAKGRNAKGHTSYGAAGTAEEALDTCLIKANKIVLRENRISKIKKFFGIRK